MQQLTEDGLTLLLAAIVRQAVDDYRDGYTNINRPDAAAFLTSAGMLSASGELDPRFNEHQKRQGRKRHDSTGMGDTGRIEVRPAA